MRAAFFFLFCFVFFPSVSAETPDTEPSGKLFKHAGGSCVVKDRVAPVAFSPLTYLAQSLVEWPYSTHAMLTQSSLQLGDKTVCIFWGPFVAKVGPSGPKLPEAQISPRSMTRSTSEC